VEYPVPEVPRVHVPDRRALGKYVTEHLDADPGGAPAVLVSGCHLTDCHYINANHQTKKRVEKLHGKFEKWGIRGERLGLAWVSAAEGAKFQGTVTRMTEIAKGVTPEEVEETKAIIARNHRFKAERMAKARAKKAGDADAGGAKNARAKNGT
jgi:coenzyme F420-reducing hydrogenase delta subunit